MFVKYPVLLPLLSAVVLFAVHVTVNGNYGFHGDELYFLECGLQPAWGYVDHPPFAPFMARVSHAMFGLSLFAFRFFPAVSLAAGCALTGLLAWRMGGRAYAMTLATLCYCAAPVFLRAGAFLNIPSFEITFWLLVAHAVVSLLKSDNPRWWLVVGLLAGLSLLNKHTTLFLGFGVGVGMLLARPRDLLTPWPWLGGLLAFLLFSPNLYWQYQNDWATLEFVSNLNEALMKRISIVDFLLAQFIFLNPAGAIVWISGAVWLLATAKGRQYALLGWIFLSMLVLLLALKSKEYYLAPAYPMLFAAGGVALETWWGTPRRRPARVVLAAAVAFIGLLFVPIATPFGSFDFKQRYAETLLGFTGASDTILFDYQFQLKRPEELVAAKVIVESLPAEVRADAVFLCSDYETAAMFNILGPQYGLPRCISGSNNYYLWGPGNASGNNVFAIRIDPEKLSRCFHKADAIGTLPPRRQIDPPGGVTVYWCREPKGALATLWPEFKRYR